MWTYVQRTGELISKIGEVVGVGYSGNVMHKNDPESQHIKDEGPIPCGLYHMLPPVDTKKHGPYFIGLIPDLINEMHGRSGFAVHGDSKDKPGEASEGCVIQARKTRELLWTSGDKELLVVAERKDVKGVDHSNLQNPHLKFH